MNPDWPTLGILASGRGSNCKAILDAVAEGGLAARPVLVLSDNSDAPVLRLAAERGVPARCIDPGRARARIAPDRERVYVDALRQAGASWIALAGFMRILGQDFLQAFPGRIVNIHPSLLPAFPGLDAAGQAHRHGVKIAGCTVHFVDEGVDSGPIIAQAPVPVEPGDTEDDLRTRVLEREHRLYIEALGLVLSGKFRIEGRRVLPTDNQGAAS